MTTFQISVLFNERFYIVSGFCWHTLHIFFFFTCSDDVIFGNKGPPAQVELVVEPVPVHEGGHPGELALLGKIAQGDAKVERAPCPALEGVARDPGAWGSVVSRVRVFGFGFAYPPNLYVIRSYENVDSCELCCGFYNTGGFNDKINKKIYS